MNRMVWERGSSSLLVGISRSHSVDPRTTRMGNGR